MVKIFSLVAHPHTGSLSLILHPGITLKNDGARWLLRGCGLEVWVAHNHELGELLALVDQQEGEVMTTAYAE